MIESKKKPVHEWVEKETYTIDQLDGYKSRPDPEYSKYGGMAGTQFPATGFFYTQKVKNRWWLVDPEGHLFIHKAVCAVSRGSGENYARNLEVKYGSNRDYSPINWLKLNLYSSSYKCL